MHPTPCEVKVPWEEISARPCVLEMDSWGTRWERLEGLILVYGQSCLSSSFLEKAYAYTFVKLDRAVDLTGISLSAAGVSEIACSCREFESCLGCEGA